MNITKSFNEIKDYYDSILNTDKSSFKSSNDEPTPIECISDMIKKIPDELWTKKNLKILDPCCGNGNFFIPIYYKLLENYHYNTKEILEQILEFNDINEIRIKNVKNIFCNNKFKLRISKDNFLDKEYTSKYDLIVANPPYAKLQSDGKRTSKNHNLIKDFLKKSLDLLNKDGYLLFITPDNWMSYADRNTLIEEITSLQIIHLDIHSAKKYFKKIGSSFTWYIIQNKPYYKNISISGIWKNKEYNSVVISQRRKYIPLFYTNIIQNILSKTIDSSNIKFKVQTSSDLHRFTKKQLISNEKNDTYIYKLIHTPKQTVYSSRPHKFQNGYKVFISTTDKYSVFVDCCGMTQSIAFILCDNKSDAEQIKTILEHPLYIFLNNICRYGNFNNIRILQNFPIPSNIQNIYNSFHLTPEEIKYIETYL